MNRASDLLVGLGKVAKIFYDHMIAKLNQGNYPKGFHRDTGDATSIQDATCIRPPQYVTGGASVQITIDLKKAPYALAYELGSGVHGREGKTYPITPHAPKKKLVFYWEKVGRVVGLHLVNHPGVAAKPYIAPSIDETKEDVKKELGKAFVASVTLPSKEEAYRVEL